MTCYIFIEYLFHFCYCAFSLDRLLLLKHFEVLRMTSATWSLSDLRQLYSLKEDLKNVLSF